MKKKRGRAMTIDREKEREKMGVIGGWCFVGIAILLLLAAILG